MEAPRRARRVRGGFVEACPVRDINPQDARVRHRRIERWRDCLLAPARGRDGGADGGGGIDAAVAHDGRRGLLPARPGEGEAGRLAAVREAAPEAERGPVVGRRAAGGEARPAVGRDDRSVAVGGHDGDEQVAGLPRRHGHGDGLRIAAADLERRLAADPGGRVAGRGGEGRGGRRAGGDGEEQERQRERRCGDGGAEDRAFSAHRGAGWYPRQESNLRAWFRKPLLCPLSYGGWP